MTPERWRRIEEIYDAALMRGEQERSALLASACAGDEGLRHEVESLLAQRASAQGFLERPAVAIAAHLIGDRESGLAGRVFGGYQVRERIGVGGMGEVYRARDTKLGRDVAIKILPQHFTTDPERLARFQREARVLASLNHPHIGAIYGIEDTDGIHALVLELVDGETLAARIKRGPLPPKDALAIADQIIDAFDAAHEKGIIHRDLKPANVKITAEGVVKVLDFGLAKLDASDPSGLDITNAPTMTVDATRDGLIMGTAAYMSPEQARGQAVDKRTDIWAFGCVLYEILTGRAAFARETVSDTIAAVIGDEPDWTLLPQALPPGSARVLRRCLERDPRKRLRDIADARAELEETSGVTQEARAGAWRVHWAWAVAMILALIAGAALSKLWPSFPPPLALGLPAQFDLSLDFDSDGFRPVPEPSPNGRFLAYLSFVAGDRRVVRVRTLAETESHVLAGTENARTFFWSADSKWIAFVVDDKIKRIAPTGGAVETFATGVAGVQEPTWGSRGDILYRTSNREPLTHIGGAGGTPEVLTHLDQSRTENSHRGQQFLPDGRRFLFTARCTDRSMNALYLGSLETKGTKRLMPVDSEVRFVSQGADQGVIVYARDGALVARRLDLNREEVEGEPFVVLDRIGYVPSGLMVSLAASADGRVAVTQSVNAALSNVEWYSRTGEHVGTLGGPGQWAQPRLSPDGTRVVVSGLDPQTGNRDVFTMDPRGVPLRLTTNGANDWYPLWSPDGRRILFGSDRPHGGTFVKLATSATAAEEPLAVSGAPEDWSRDGRWLVGSSGAGPWVAEAKAGAAPTVLPLAPRGRVDGLSLSPDGRWLAYVSDESGMFEVYVRRFEGPGVGADAIQISRGGGDFPVWNGVGGELLFASADDSLWSFNTKGLASGGVPDPVRLFRPCESSSMTGQPIRGASFMRGFDTHDGTRFVVTCTVEPPGRFSVLLNWPFAPQGGSSR